MFEVCSSGGQKICTIEIVFTFSFNNPFHQQHAKMSTARRIGYKESVTDETFTLLIA